MRRGNGASMRRPPFLVDSDHGEAIWQIRQGARAGLHAYGRVVVPPQRREDRRQDVRRAVAVTDHDRAEVGAIVDGAGDVPDRRRPMGDHRVQRRQRHAPAWWLNLRSQPDASVQIGRETYPVTAVEAAGDERERLWRRTADMYEGYDGYARKTTRKIPVVLLQRR